MRCKSSVPILFHAVRIVVLFVMEPIRFLISKNGRGIVERETVLLLVGFRFAWVSFEPVVILHWHKAHRTFRNHTTVNGGCSLQVRIAVISLDFSAQAACPSKSPYSLAQMLTECNAPIPFL